ncbi:hypothetical protein D9M71_567610 [compost metagenome]
MVSGRSPTTISHRPSLVARLTNSKRIRRLSISSSTSHNLSANAAAEVFASKAAFWALYRRPIKPPTASLIFSNAAIIPLDEGFRRTGSPRANESAKSSRLRARFFRPFHMVISSMFFFRHGKQIAHHAQAILETAKIMPRGQCTSSPRTKWWCRRYPITSMQTLAVIRSSPSTVRPARYSDASRPFTSAVGTLIRHWAYWEMRLKLLFRAGSFANWRNWHPSCVAAPD